MEVFITFEPSVQRAVDSRAMAPDRRWIIYLPCFDLTNCDPANLDQKNPSLLREEMSGRQRTIIPSIYQPPSWPWFLLAASTLRRFATSTCLFRPLCQWCRGDGAVGAVGGVDEFVKQKSTVETIQYIYKLNTVLIIYSIRFRLLIG